MSLGPMELLIVVVIVLLLFGRIDDFLNKGGGSGFGAVPVKPTRQPVPPPEEKKRDWIIDDQPCRNDEPVR